MGMDPTVVLIQPRPLGIAWSIRFIPHGLLALASTLQDRYKVIIVNRAIYGEDEHVYEILRNNNVVCAGFSVMTGGSILDALELTRSFKRHAPQVPIIWGGWHATQVPMSIMAEPDVDYIVQGEGEFSFSKLVDALRDKASVASIEGVGYRDNEKPHLNPMAAPLDVDILPPRPYELLGNIEPYIIPHWIPGSKRCISLESSRGCPYGCTFCEISSHFHRSYRSMSPGKLHAEVVRLKSLFDVDGINFCDANFFLNLDRARRFSRIMIESGTKISWGASGTIMQFSKIKDEDLLLFKQAGLTSVAFGVESASERVRQEILKKKFTNEDLSTVARKMEQAGLQTKIYMMLGLPGERVEDSLQTVDFTIELIEKHSNLATSGSMNIYTPFPKTALSHQAEAMGYKFPETLEGYASLTMRGTSGLVYLEPNHYTMLRNISLMSTFLCMTKENIFFTGLKRVFLAIARSFYLFRLKRHLFFSSPDLYILRRFFKA